MANTAITQTAIPAVFRIGKPDGLIYPVLVSMDTLASDLTVLAAAAGKFWCIYGAFWQEAAAHELQIKSGTVTALVTLEFSGNDGLRCPLSANPFIVGRVGEALNLQLSAGSLSSALFYVGHQSVLDMHG